MTPADQTFTDSLFTNENDDRLNGGPVDQLGGTEESSDLGSQDSLENIFDFEDSAPPS